MTPVYNGADYLVPLIESVAAQDYPHIEHLVIDDGSTDDGATVAVLEQYPHLRWWSRENRGQYPTMNEGLSAAEGEIICFISADDLMTPGAVQAVVDKFLAHPELDGVYGKMLWMGEDGSIRYAQEVITRAPLWFHRYKPFISHCSLYIKRDAIERNDLLFDSSLRYLGDFDWINRIADASLKIKFLDKVLSMVRFHEQQTSRVHADAIKMESKLIQERHGINRLLVKITLFILHWITIVQAAWRAYNMGGMNEVRRVASLRTSR
ncbi:MAG: glycosyltransferase [Anaerolineae bacterium]|nr:glycosyltransferase [Anaerolineae bacterium]